MADYTFSIGTHDPSALTATTDGEAIAQAVETIRSRFADELKTNPQEVVTLMGAGGLVTRPSERIDEFVARVPGPDPAADPVRMQPGDTNAPDCNGD